MDGWRRDALGEAMTVEERELARGRRKAVRSTEARAGQRPPGRGDTPRGRTQIPSIYSMGAV